MDQVILGLAIGLSCSIFVVKCFKPYMFDPVFYPKVGENMNVSVQRAKKAFQISAFCYLLILCKMIGLYLYVDSTSEIPEQWFDSIKATCPVFKLSNLFHHFSITHTGYLTMLPSCYLWNWLRLRQW
jgi:hypothetical protein